MIPTQNPKRFIYEVLIGQSAGVPAGVTWSAGSSGQKLGPELIHILNDLGQQGWEVVSIGDLGFDAKSEILLKKEV